MSIAKHIQSILEEIDPNPKRPDLEGTPVRVAEALKFFTEGYHVDIQSIFENALFESHDHEMIIIQNIEFYSMCEHHLLPFFGECHIAYIPQKHILGLSKFGEIVDVFSRRLQIQERLSTEIADCLFQELQPLGLGVIIKANHLCMKMRGIQKQKPLFITQKMLGALQEPQHQMNFLSAIQHTHQNPELNSGCEKP